VVVEWWQRNAVRRGARLALQTQQTLFHGSHAFAPADPAAFRRLDASFYAGLRETLEREGFRFLGDVEDLTITQQSPAMRTFIRVTSGDRGEVMASFYHVRPTGMVALLQAVGLVPRRIQILDLETELSDGSWLITVNSQGVDTTPAELPISCERLPLRTPALDQLARHRERVRAALAERPELRPRTVHSMNEALAAQDRLQQIRNQQLAGTEAIVRTIESQPGAAGAKRLLIEEVRRTGA